MNGAEQSFRRTAADCYFDLGIDGAAVKSLDFGCDCLPQRGHTGHRRILVCTAIQVISDPVKKCLVRIEARKTLRQVYRATLFGESAHHRENRSAGVRQFAVHL
jgi:hypothetical protein